MVKDLGKRIREAREAGGITRAELAGKLDVSMRQLRRFEAGEGLTVKRLLQIAHALGVPVREFLGSATRLPHVLLNPREARLLELFRRLGSERMKDVFLDILQELADMR